MLNKFTITTKISFLPQSKIVKALQKKPFSFNFSVLKLTMHEALVVFICVAAVISLVVCEIFPSNIYIQPLYP